MEEFKNEETRQIEKSLSEGEYVELIRGPKTDRIEIVEDPEDETE